MSNKKKRASVLMRSIGTQTPRSNSVDILYDNSSTIFNYKNELNNDITLENSKVIMNSLSQSQINKSEVNIEFQFRSSRMKYKKLKMNPIMYNRTKEEIKKHNLNNVNNQLKPIKEKKSITNIDTHSYHNKTPNNNYISKFKYPNSKRFEFNQSIVQQILSLQHNYFNNNTYHRKSSLNNIKITTNNRYNRMNGNHSLNDLSLNKNYSLRNTKSNVENNQNLLPLLEINNVMKPKNNFQNQRLKLLRKSNKQYNLSFFKPPKYFNDNSKHFICNNKLSYNKEKLSLSNNSSIKNYNNNMHI